MRIPSALLARDELYRRVQEQCFQSRQRRIEQYNRNKMYYLRGTGDGTPVTVNKFQSHIPLLKSYLYSEETTRFALELGESAPKADLQKVDPMTAHLLNEWHDSNSDSFVSQCVEWALVWDSTFLKLNWSRGKDDPDEGSYGLMPYFVPPHNFGVYREDVTELDRQEGCAMQYQITRSELEWQLRHHPRAASIMKDVTPSAPDASEPQYPQVIREILMSQVTPNLIGTVDLSAGPVDSYVPVLPDDMVTLVDMWIFDSATGDYQWITRTEATQLTIYDRPWVDAYLPRQLPFVQFRPKPMPGYFFGQSELSFLIPLQDALAKRVEDIRHLLSKQVRPSYAGIGLQFDADEFRTAMDSEYGYTSSADSNGKLQPLVPEMPQDAFAEVHELERFFDDQSGITGVVKGQNLPGLRSKGQTDTLAKLGSVRLKDRTMIIEDSLDTAGTLALKLIQRNDDREMQYVSTEFSQGAGKTVEIDFIPNQFTDDFAVKVDGHSNSPVFVEDAKADASEMLDKGIITKETFVRLRNPPMKQKILADLPIIEKKQQEAEQQEKREELEEKQLRAVK